MVPNAARKTRTAAGLNKFCDIHYISSQFANKQTHSNTHSTKLSLKEIRARF